MKKLILQVFVSVDGFAADREKETVFFDGTDYNLGAEVAERQEEFIKSLNLILLGAETYRFFESHPQPKGSTVAKMIDEIPKVVFSKSLTATEVHTGNQKNVTLVTEDAVSYIEDLKVSGDKNIVVWGSLTLAQSLLRAGLFDEIQLITAPVAIGKGYRLFPEDIELLPLKLTEAKTFPGGATLHIYEPQKPLK